MEPPISERCIAEAKTFLSERKFQLCREAAIRAQTFDPQNPVVPQILAVANTLIAKSEITTTSLDLPDWYAILGVPRYSEDVEIYSGYTKLCLLLEPHNSRLPFAQEALNVVNFAFNQLLGSEDETTKSRFDEKLIVLEQKSEGAKRSRIVRCKCVFCTASFVDGRNHLVCWNCRELLHAIAVETLEGGEIISEELLNDVLKKEFKTEDVDLVMLKITEDNRRFFRVKFKNQIVYEFDLDEEELGREDDDDPKIDPEACEILVEAVKTFLSSRQLELCKETALTAQSFDPQNAVVAQILAVADILIAAETPVTEALEDWYAILGVKRYSDDFLEIKDQYKRLCLLLDPNENPGITEVPHASDAFCLVNKAWYALGNCKKISQYNSRLRIIEKGLLEYRPRKPLNRSEEESKPPIKSRFSGEIRSIEEERFLKRIEKKRRMGKKEKCALCGKKLGATDGHHVTCRKCRDFLRILVEDAWESGMYWRELLLNFAAGIPVIPVILKDGIRLRTEVVVPGKVYQWRLVLDKPSMLLKLKHYDEIVGSINVIDDDDDDDDDDYWGDIDDMGEEGNGNDSDDWGDIVDLGEEGNGNDSGEDNIAGDGGEDNATVEHDVAGNAAGADGAAGEGNAAGEDDASDKNLPPKKRARTRN